MHESLAFGGIRVLVLALVLSAGCGGGSGRTAVETPVECSYTTLPPRFCGPSEDEMLWRESDPQPMRVCNGCLTVDDCVERPGGECVELQGEGCTYSAFVCVYPGDPCAGDRSGCEGGECVNREGRAVCAQPGEAGAQPVEPRP
jgi:hypothetical protein